MLMREIKQDSTIIQNENQTCHILSSNRITTIQFDTFSYRTLIPIF